MSALAQPAPSFAARLSDADRRLAEKGPAYLARWLTRGRYQIPPHIQLLNDALVQAATQGNARVIVSMPPRHGKSALCSHWGPVWFLRRFPERYYAVASYAQSLAQGFGRKARNEIAAAPPGFRLEVAKDSAAAHTWHTHAGGGFIGVGVGSGFTGRGADFLVIDDPVKDAAEAFSPTVKGNVWDWWLSVASTRLEPGASVFVVMTRWADDDLAGRLEKEGLETGQPWTVIRIPALCEDPLTDPLARAEGEALWPDRVTQESLEARRDRGDWEWPALYQQRPLTSVGGSPITMDDLPTWDMPPDPARAVWLQSWDPNFEDLDPELVAKAGKRKKQKRSRFGGIIACRVGAQIYLMDHYAEHADFEKQQAVLLDKRERWPRTTKTYLEFRGNGAALGSQLKRVIPGIWPVRPTESKLLRLHAVHPFFRAHNILFPPEASSPWAASLKKRLCNWPNVEFDDDIDALTQLVAGELLPEAPTEKGAAEEAKGQAFKAFVKRYAKSGG